MPLAPETQRRQMTVTRRPSETRASSERDRWAVNRALRFRNAQRTCFRLTETASRCAPDLLRATAPLRVDQPLGLVQSPQITRRHRGPTRACTHVPAASAARTTLVKKSTSKGVRSSPTGSPNMTPTIPVNIPVKSGLRQSRQDRSSSPSPGHVAGISARGRWHPPGSSGRPPRPGGISIRPPSPVAPQLSTIQITSLS
jgi:hypothetical protein